MVERYLMPDPDDHGDMPHARDYVMASDYDAMADCYANEHICAVNARKRADALAADVADVAKINVDLMKRNRALEAALRKLGYAAAEYIGKRGDGDAFADLVQAEHEARALLPSQIDVIVHDLSSALETKGDASGN